MDLTKYFTLFFSICIPILAVSQPILKPSIGLSALPADSDPVCSIPTFSGNFNTSGISEGDTIADFTLYDLNDNEYNIKDELADGKPILLVSGSYTCPVFRNRVSEMNTIYNDYSNDIKVFIVYTVEAHPDIDISPYFGFVNTGAANISQGILHRQPTTYAERKDVVSDMIADVSPLPVVLIDGPCNEWWSYFGPAPQNAYLIDTNGVVFEKHGWFNKYPPFMDTMIDSLLNGTGTSGECINGSFNFTLTGIELVIGYPGETLYGYGSITNNSTSCVWIDVVRTENNIPSNWQTAMCLDVCLGPEEDSTLLYLEPGATQSYTMYFFSDGSQADNGDVKMVFTNVDDPSNSFEQPFFGQTQGAGVSDITQNNKIFIYPNPLNPGGNLYFEGLEPNATYTLELYDLLGQLTFVYESTSSEFNVQAENSGLHIYKLYKNRSFTSSGKLLVH
ncbi:MAG: T9SS type A sorting domain-containing protein [Bacteroidetes bacterium]|nr:T9SS type A sorting domain-containing protein [Bacteroidota bacterium]